MSNLQREFLHLTSNGRVAHLAVSCPRECGFVGKLRPGERVPRSGLYRVYHDAHRLMHEAALLTDDAFPSCKQCGPAVRFEFIRRLHDRDILPFGSGEILEKWEDKTQDEEAS